MARGIYGNDNSRTCTSQIQVVQVVNQKENIRKEMTRVKDVI